ncbi:hypothetical protein WICMUC_005911 [Wickerhamomyces mucosus]|uniref:tRNA pseudouridine synthase 1 n=1 Tax=Wickerhamomyces mucosus TaxID=1378264 RepID=A0A9P8P1K6_9ASCO|nr:hypothetical protein WICMUC_005911 [Wickerhamomyces mucosus]
MDQPGEDTYKRGQILTINSLISKPDREYEVRENPNKILDAEGNPIQRKPKKKVAVMVGYCGTGYHGMQINPPAKTIEGDIYSALVKAGAVSQYNADDPKKSGFMRAARTDKGVHAAGNLISLKMTIEDEDILKKINDNLPPTIRIWGIERTNKAFDCRKMCGSRVYEYLIPTYSFLAPKPTSILAQRIKEADEKHPGKTRKDEESEEFWAKFDKEIQAAGFTEEDLTTIREHRALSKEDYDESNPTVRLVKRYKSIENRMKRSFRVSKEKLDLMRKATSFYLGHHNFHNFTLGKPFTDASAGRFMKNITVSEPFVIDQTEWSSIKIHGQSFMLHQIRKMIAMATLVVRSGCPLERINEAFNAEKINIPKAPALGLLLEQPVYTGYNQRLEDYGYKPIDFRKYAEEMDAFKMKHIYDKIYAEEVAENVFNGFFNFIDSHNGEHIFDFLTAKGITKLSKDELKEVQIPNEKEANENTDDDNSNENNNSKPKQQRETNKEFVTANNIKETKQNVKQESDGNKEEAKREVEETQEERSRTSITKLTKLEMILIPHIIIIIRLESLYCLAASDGQPLYNAYEQKTVPKLPNPETKAALIATPISPCNLEKMSAVIDIIVGIVAPKPKPAINKPP